MSFFGQIADTWQALIDLIIRPPRHEYSVARDLGARRLVVKGVLVIREDIELMTRRGTHGGSSKWQAKDRLASAMRGRS